MRKLPIYFLALVLTSCKCEADLTVKPQKQSEQEKITELNNKCEDMLRLNDRKFNIGDTLSATFLIDEHFIPKRIMFSRWMPDSVYFANEELRIKMIGIVTDKFLENPEDSATLVFKCLILTVSDTDSYATNYDGSEVKLSVGNLIDIPLFGYGRELGKE